MTGHTVSAPPIGTCTLVGAGPGDPELLTLKALKAIQRATVLFVDDLVNPDIVAMASPQARTVYVGKRGGCQSTPQAFIERLMLAAVREGEHVVRLKGGDPFIFGRGGEELAHLQAAGVTVHVVNGITAGLAAATSLGVPLTHRDHAHGVVFMTGHRQARAAVSAGGGQAAPSSLTNADPSGPIDTDSAGWQALAATAHHAKLTLVIYMGVRGARRIQRDLLTGLPASTPVAVIQNASLPSQRHTLTTLCDLAAAISREQLASPCIMVVGDVLCGLAAAQAADAAQLATLQRVLRR